MEAFVGLFCAAKSGEHPHRPQAATVHAVLCASGVGILAGHSEFVVRLKTLEIILGVDRFGFETTHRIEQHVAFREFCGRLCVLGLQPNVFLHKEL
jgi:hypothetical protein